MAERKDASRNILIDETTVDINLWLFRNAREVMDTLVQELNPAKLDNNYMQGDLRKALDARLMKMSKDISEQSRECGAMISDIKDVMSKYEEIDSKAAQSMKG